MNPHHRGISLAEVLAVLAIIATISVLAVPQLFVGPASKPESSRLLDQDMLQTAIELYQLEHEGASPGRQNSLGSDLRTYLPSNGISPDHELLFGLPVYSSEHQQASASADMPIEAHWNYDPNQGSIEFADAR